MFFSITWLIIDVKYYVLRYKKYKNYVKFAMAYNHADRKEYVPSFNYLWC